VIQLFVAIKTGVFAGVLGDTDVYMWLTRVLELHESGDWSNHILGRVDPPGGYEQHWTRPFDMLLFAGAWIGALIADFGSALYVWSGLISPVLEILALLAVFWALSPLLRGSGNEVLGLLFITQMGVITSFVAGRADHQSLIILLFILSLGFGIRILVSPCSRLLCYCTGLVSAFAVWVSIESLLFSLVVYLALGIFWLFGEKGIARKLLHYSLSVFLLLILFRFIEYGRLRLFEPAFDQISIVYIALFGVLLAYWALVYWYEELRGESWRLPGRFGVAVSGLVVTGMLLETSFPGFLSGPMGNMDELFRRVHLVKIKELQPVVPLHALTSDNLLQYLTRFSLWLGIIIPGIPVLLYLLSRSSGSSRMAWAYILLASLVYLPLAFREIRWAPYVAILMLPGYAWLVTRAMQEITDRIQGGAAGILRITVLVASVIIFALPRAIAGDTDAESEASACPLIPVSRFLNDPQGWGGRPRKILAFTDFGPELLYRTRHSVFSIPSHRFHAGFSDSYHIMTALDDGQALEKIRERHIDLVLVCPGGHEDHFYARKDGKEIFHQRISEGRIPEWLNEIVLPADAAQSFRLYAVEYQPL
jgi:hypothetical protein